MKKYINAILTLSSVLVLFYIIYDQHKQINKYKEMEKSMEVLQTDSFQFHLIADRYSIALELLREEDSVAAAKFEKILQNQTE
jgi:hypothetical protein